MKKKIISRTQCQDMDTVEEPFDLDKLLKPLGGFGKFQILNLIQIAVIVSFASMTELMYVFTASELNHRCRIDECENATAQFDQPWTSAAIPLTSSGSFSWCTRYNTSAIGSCSNNSFNHDVIGCDEFIYETEEWTIAREGWGISCEDDRWMLTLIGSLNNAGEVVGSAFVGFLSDKFGRRSVIVNTAVIVAILGTIQSFSVNYAMFAVMEFLGTTMEAGLFTLSFVLALEIVEPSKRVLAGTLVTCGYSIGETILAAVQWLTFDWRTLLRIVRVPFLLLIIFNWTLPESVRWLISKGRRADAVNVLKKIASYNGTVLSKEAEESVPFKDQAEKITPDKKRTEIISLLKSAKLRFRFFAILFVWIANTFIFNGINLNSVSINSNKFLNFILTSLIEIPAYLLTIFVLERFGRRKIQSGSLFLCAVGCLLFAFTPSDWTVAQLALYLIGKFGVAMSFVIVDIYTTELFPTSVRGATISIGHMVGRAAAILAPQTPLLSDIYQPLPLLVFSALAAIGGSLAITLPETLNTKLPDTVTEAEMLGRRRTKF